MTTEDSIDAFMRKIRRYPILPRERQIELARQAKPFYLHRNNEFVRAIDLKRAIAAREKLINHNLGLVVNIAKKYRQKTDQSLSLLDLFQEGVIGFDRAIELYDPESGNAFSTYACYWIKHRIQRAVEAQSRTIRLPNHIHTKRSKIRQCYRDLTVSLNRQPTIAELSELTGYSIAVIAELTDRSLRHALSLNYKSPNGDDEAMSWIAIESANTPNQLAERLDFEGAVQTVFAALTPVEREVMDLRFGLNGQDEHKIVEIVQIKRWGEGEVKNIIFSAKRKLRKNKKVMATIADCLSS